MFTREVGGTSTGVKAWRRLSGLDGVDRRSVLFQVGRRLRSGDLRRRLRQQSLVPAAGAAGRAQRAAVTAAPRIAAADQPRAADAVQYPGNRSQLGSASGREQVCQYW